MADDTHECEFVCICAHDKENMSAEISHARSEALNVKRIATNGTLICRWPKTAFNYLVRVYYCVLVPIYFWKTFESKKSNRPIILQVRETQMSKIKRNTSIGS